MKNNPQLLSRSQALKQGAQLWILSEPESCSWNHVVDWYLCFQMRKNRLKKLDKPSEKVQALLKKHHFYSFEWYSSQYCPTLIESSKCLPNLWTVELPYHTQWISKAYDVWYSLNQPPLRIFTPQLVKKQEIEEKWKRLTNTDIQYILD